jgi:hypothetical protein
MTVLNQDSTLLLVWRGFRLDAPKCTNSDDPDVLRLHCYIRVDLKKQVEQFTPLMRCNAVTVLRDAFVVPQIVPSTC